MDFKFTENKSLDYQTNMAEWPKWNGASFANARPSSEPKPTKERSTLQKNRSQTSGVQENRLLCEISQTGIGIAALSQSCNDEKAELPVSSRYILWHSIYDLHTEFG